MTGTQRRNVVPSAGADDCAAELGCEVARPTRFASGTIEMAPFREDAHLIEDDIAEIAHDLKSPLGAIALDATILVERFRAASQSAGLRSITRIQQNVAFLDRLVLD